MVSTNLSNDLANSSQPESSLSEDVFVFPLSFSQQRLWLLDQIEGENAAYNIPMAMLLTGILNIPALEQAFVEIVARHESLRTNFQVVDDVPMQLIAEAVDFQMKVVDMPVTTGLPSLPVPVEQFITKETQRSFNLMRDPLFRVKLLRLDAEHHVLIMTMHHIIADGWSLGVLSRELTELYNAFNVGKPSPLAPLPIQYADFAHWQQDFLAGDQLNAHLEYWQQQLAGVPPLLELPTDRLRPSVQTLRGDTVEFQLSPVLSKNLKQLAQQSQSTLFMTLLTTFSILLHRYSGFDDIVVGSPIANRQRSELEPLIGCFINTLVLRTQLTNNLTFSDVLAQVRQTALEAYVHQDLPFEKLVEELKPERSLSHSPLFQVMFVLHNTPSRHQELDGVSLSPIKRKTSVAKFDWNLSMAEVDDAASPYLVGRWEYNSDLFDVATVKRAVGHFKTLLQAIVANPDAQVATLPLLTDVEQHQLLIDWNDTETTYPQDKCLHQLIEAQAARTPDAVAVVFNEDQLTYSDLNERANQLAAYLRSCGVGPEVLVGLYVERSLDMVVALLGILKAGGAYVPLDPGYPCDRINDILSNSQAKIVVTQQTLLASLPATSAQLVCLDTDWHTITQTDQSTLDVEVAPDNLAYVIYTSGSTGKPKGVQICHRSLVNFLTSMQESPGLTPADVMLAVTTICFDIAALELYLPLMVGAQVVLTPQEVATDGQRLLAMLAQSGATIMQATPATWRMLLAAGWQGSPQLKILCGGEALPHTLATDLHSRGTALWNLYGPTETTIWSTRVCLNAAHANNNDKLESTAPIGRPIANTQIYVLDKALQPVPIGIPGELHIGGVGVARGYLNRPDLTAARFISNPFSAAAADRLYKTGDLVRYLPDGNLEFLGRIDHQVKIRGFRVELGEIEAALVQHPQVREAVVITRPDQSGSQQLVAYLINSGEQSTVDNLMTYDLRSLLKERLPDYMVPAVFVWLEWFPLTPNGKIDRQALPAPDPSQRALENTFVAPDTEIEKQLAQIWSDLLNLEQVGVHDSFFELGGHSLLATQMVSRIRAAFSVEVPLRTLFESSTITKLADCIEVIQEINQGHRQNSSNWGGDTTEEREEIEF